MKEETGGMGNVLVARVSSCAAMGSGYTATHNQEQWIPLYPND